MKNVQMCVLANNVPHLDYLLYMYFAICLQSLLLSAAHRERIAMYALVIDHYIYCLTHHIGRW